MECLLVKGVDNVPSSFLFVGRRAHQTLRALKYHSVTHRVKSWYRRRGASLPYILQKRHQARVLPFLHSRSDLGDLHPPFSVQVPSHRTGTDVSGDRASTECRGRRPSVFPPDPHSVAGRYSELSVSRPRGQSGGSTRVFPGNSSQGVGDEGGGSGRDPHPTPRLRDDPTGVLGPDPDPPRSVKVGTDTFQWYPSTHRGPLPRRSDGLSDLTTSQCARPGCVCRPFNSV